MLYLVRIQLHYETRADYDKLHDAIQKVGFAKTVNSEEGKSYDLPHAEYVREMAEDDNRDDILASVIAAIESVTKHYDVTFSDVARMSFRLQAHTPPPPTIHQIVESLRKKQRNKGV